MMKNAWKEAKVGMSKKNEENEQHENIDEADLVTEDEKIDTTMDEDADMMTNVRNLSGWVRYVFMTIAVIGALYHLYILNFNPIDPWVFRSTHLVFGTVLGLMLYPGWRTKSNKIHIIDWILIIITIFIGYYIYANLDQLIFRFGVNTTYIAFYFALVGILLVIDF